MDENQGGDEPAGLVALETVLDIFVLASLNDDPSDLSGAQWARPDLHAAFQWCHVLANAPSSPALLHAAQVTTTASARPAGVKTTQLQGISRPKQLHIVQSLKQKLPYAVKSQLDSILRNPERALLAWLLERRGQRSGWELDVLSAYVATCVLSAPLDRQLRAEGDLVAVITQLRQRNDYLVLMQAAVHQAAQSATVQRAVHAACGQQTGSADAAVQALQYFTSLEALQTAATAQLLLRAWGESGTTGDLLADLPMDTPEQRAECVQVLAMALLLPSLQELIRHLAHGSQSAGPKTSQNQPSKAAAKVTAALCSLLQAHPAVVLHAHPTLLAHACRTSLRLTASYARAIQELYESGRAAPKHLAGLLQHACALHDDHAASFLRAKLAGKLPL